MNFFKVFFLFTIGLLHLLGCAGVKETVRDNTSLEVIDFHIAVLPVENLSGKPAPLTEIRQMLINKIKILGLDILEDEFLDWFMEQNRIRYTGGIDSATAKSFKEEMGADAVLITSLEFYDAEYPPKIALISRLVSTGDKPVILWMDGTGLTGDDAPGILGLGLIDNPLVIQDNAIINIAVSLSRYITGRLKNTNAYNLKFRPRIYYRSPLLHASSEYTIALIPFLNKSSRKNAGEIVMLHFAKELMKMKNFEIIEPGITRQSLLNFRIMMSSGISIADTDLLSNTLDADLILTGTVMDYQDYEGTWGTPKVNFYTLVIERKSKRVFWISSSDNRGDDGVFFFNLGRINTAHAMTSKMANSVVKIMEGR